MRSIETLTLRVKCGLPITFEEAEALHAHLDAVLARQRKFVLCVAAVWATVAACLVIWLILR